jgi:hypothetical protein
MFFGKTKNTTMDSYDSEENLKPVVRAKPSFWQKIGGGSLLIAALFHVALLVIGGFWVFQIVRQPEKKVDFMPSGGGGGQRGAETVSVKKRAQITPSTNVKRVFAEGAQATYSIPEQGDNFGEMSTLSSLAGGGLSGGLGGSGAGAGFGKGAGLGGGMGLGGGVGKMFGLIPETMRKRCSKEDRLTRLKENGGTPACDEAVTKGLRWLKIKQNPDGSWNRSYQPAMTGLALLAYLGHCETPASEEFGDSSMKAFVYLVNLGMKNDGKLSSNFTSNGWVYEHAIATYALAEAATFCKELKVEIPGLMEVTGKAGQFIIDNQHKNGGWAYLYNTGEKAHTDTSIVGWQLQALKACSHTNIEFKGMSSCISKGLEYLSEMQNENGGFGYGSRNSPSGGRKYFNLTGVGALCYQMWGKGNSSEARKGVKYIRENTKFDWNTEDSDIYSHYYESQAMMQAGGDDWKFYNDIFRDQLLNNQNPDGGWKAPKARGHGAGGNEVYRNSLSILMLEVYYRYLNSSGGGIRQKPKI